MMVYIKKFIDHKNQNGLREAILASFRGLFPIYVKNKNTWGLSYAIRYMCVNYVPPDYFYKKRINKLISSLPKLQLGAGDCICEGWLHQDLKKFQNRKHNNLDITLNVLRLNKYIEDSTLELILTSHMLEHLPRHEAKELLSSCYKWLKPGGELWISVPDLSILYEIAKSNNISNEERDLLMNLIATPFPGHVSCWFYEDLKQVLESCGFSRVYEWTSPPEGFKNVDGCWNASVNNRLISLNLRAIK